MCARCVLQNLDRSTLKLLRENSRLELFTPSLVENLQEFYDRATVASPQLPPKPRYGSTHFRRKLWSRSQTSASTKIQVAYT